MTSHASAAPDTPLPQPQRAAAGQSPAPGGVVTYVAGSGRSGSTLLDRLLNETEGVVAIGELVYLWEPDQLDRHVCGCGKPVRDCEFWSAVADRAFGGWESPGYQRITELRRSVLRHRYLPLLAAPWLSRAFRRRVRELVQLLVPVYDAVAEVSGATVIVDSSKEVAYAYALRRALRDRLRIVHLLRNGYGVAYSWTKLVAKPEIGNPQAALDRYQPSRMAARWVGYNVALEGVRVLGIRPLIVHYEDVVDRPVEQLNRILGAAGLPDRDDYPFIHDGQVELKPSHSVAGNPMRFRQGLMPLRRDEAWRTKMRPRDRRVVSLIAGPLLWRVGYVGPRARRRALEVSGATAGNPAPPPSSVANSANSANSGNSGNSAAPAQPAATSLPADPTPAGTSEVGS
jgi:hypothetical protein